MGHVQGLGRRGAWGALDFRSTVSGVAKSQPRQWAFRLDKAWTQHFLSPAHPQPFRSPAHPQPPPDNTKVTTRRLCRCFNLWHFIPHQRLSRRHENERWMRRPALSRMKVTIVSVATRCYSCCSTRRTRKTLAARLLENNNRDSRANSASNAFDISSRKDFLWLTFAGWRWKWEKEEKGKSLRKSANKQICLLVDCDDYSVS